MHRTSLPIWQARPSTVVCALVGIVAAGACVLVSATSEANVPQYQRRAASEAACKEAAAGLLRLRLQSPITFADDCRRPRVTPLSNKPGLLIVTRVVDMQIGRATARRTYSALMDGRHIDAWRVMEVESAPNELSVVLSPLPLTATSELAER